MNPSSFGTTHPSPRENEGGDFDARITNAAAPAAAADRTEGIVSSMAKMKLQSQLDELEQNYLSKVNDIRRETADEKRDIIERIETEKQILIAELYTQEDLNLMQAKDDFEKRRQRLLKEVSVTQTCSSCETDHKCLSAVCIECKSVSLCEKCLKKEIIKECQCSNCSIIVNIICAECQKIKLREAGWFHFDSCRCGCGHLCPEHSTVLLCQSCGYHCFCDGPRRKCELKQCSSCKIILCMACRKSDGCLCKSSFSSFDDSSWNSVSHHGHGPPLSDTDPSTSVNRNTPDTAS